MSAADTCENFSKKGSSSEIAIASPCATPAGHHILGTRREQPCLSQCVLRIENRAGCDAKRRVRGPCYKGSLFPAPSSPTRSRPRTLATRSRPCGTLRRPVAA
eukprot:587021-Rhodomonas_salina.2